MNFEIIWSEFAEKQLDEIFEFYVSNANNEVAQKVILDLVTETEPLKHQPFIGQIEEWLKDREISYRYLVYEYFKIIYSVDKENGLIKIADIFDTRQNPIKIKRSK